MTMANQRYFTRVQLQRKQIIESIISPIAHRMHFAAANWWVVTNDFTHSAQAHPRCAQNNRFLPLASPAISYSRTHEHTMWHCIALRIGNSLSAFRTQIIYLFLHKLISCVMKCTQQQKLESCVSRYTEHGWRIGTWCTPHDEPHAFSAKLVDQPERHHAHLNQANEMCNAHEFVAGRLDAVG